MEDRHTHKVHKVTKTTHTKQQKQMSNPDSTRNWEHEPGAHGISIVSADMPNATSFRYT